MFPQQLDLKPLSIGESWTVRLNPADGLELDVFLRIVTAGGSVICVPLRTAGDIVFTAGADSGETRLEIYFGAGAPASASQIN